MSCHTCSNSAFTCSKANFSIPVYPSCTLTSHVPGVPAHHFNLICNNNCQPLVSPFPSANHGVSCNSFNGYHHPTIVVMPGHFTSCSPCPMCSNYPCCNCYSGD